MHIINNASFIGENLLPEKNMRTRGRRPSLWIRHC